MKIRSLVILMLITSSLLAEGVKSPLPSLSWQAKQLEDDINQKVTNTLLRLLKPNEFTVDVSVGASDPTSPEWNKSDEDGNGTRNPASGGAAAGAGASAEDKTADSDIDKDKEDERPQQASNPNKVRYDDIDMPDRPEDFVVFNKFGLEAPLIDDYNDFRPDGKIILTMGDDSEEKERKKKEEEAAKEARNPASVAQGEEKTSDIEKIWKYNEAIDLFKNLSAVKIFVRVSEGLPDEQKQLAEKFVKAMTFNLGGVKPSVKVEFSKLGSDFQEDEKTGNTILEILSVLGQYATFLGIVLGVILAGMVGNKLIAKFFELNTGNQNQTSMSMEGGDSKDEDDSSPSAIAAGGGEGGSDNDLSINGVARFISFIGHSKEEAILLVKKWIKQKGKNEEAALKALVQQMDNDALRPILGAMSESEKNEWRELLDEGMSPEEFSRANAFIGSQIIQNIMVPSFIKDPNLYGKIIQIKPQQFSKIVESDFDTACLLLSLMSSEFVNTVLTSFEPSEREKIIQGSMGVTPDQFESSQDKINEALSFIANDKGVRPFLDSLSKIIPSAGLEVEELLYTNYVKEAEMSKVDYMLKENFPGFLFQELPDELIKSVFNNYPLSKRVKLLKSLPQDMCDQYISIFAPEGTKAYDLINIEFETIEGDEMMLKEIEKNKDEYWASFMQHARKMIKAEKQYAGQVEELVTNWRAGITGEEAVAA